MSDIHEKKATKIITGKKKGTNRHWKNFVDKNYLGSHNLEAGEEMLLTIDRFEGEEKVKGTDGKESIKQVLYFKEDVPKMIMNQTNGTVIASLYGNHPEQWIGKKVQVYSAKVMSFGTKQDALRVRDFIPKRDIDISPFVSQLDSAKTLDELKNVWSSLPVSVRNEKDLITKKDEVKAKLTV